MLKHSLIILTVFVFSTVGLAQNKSLYSDLNPENCRDAGTDRSVPGLFYGICKGVGGFDLEYYLDDERNSLGVVFPSKKVVPLDFWSYFRDFSELGTKAEWRMKGNEPIALIVRLNVSDQGDWNKKTSYLIVTKIADETACVTDVLKPEKNQNANARRLADKASIKQCMAGFADSETEEPQAILLDEFSFTNDEDLMARLDEYFVRMQNRPDAAGVIIVKGKEGARIKAEKKIKDYIKRMMFESRLMHYGSEPGDGATVIALWIVPPGAKMPG